MSDKKTYVVIGLGIFGSTLAKTMVRSGADVIAIDRDISAVENAADTILNSVQADSTDITQLREAGVEGADVAVVSMGSELESSIITIMNLRELHVGRIYAKANNHRYGYVLERVGADVVLQPEREAGQRLAERILNPNIIELFNVDDSYTILEIKAPQLWQGRSLADLHLRSHYNVNVIGIRKGPGEKLSMHLTPEYVIDANDSLVVATEIGQLKQLDLD